MTDRNFTSDEAETQMQEMIDTWEGGLKASGGALVPSKCWVYPIDYRFDDKGEPSYKRREEFTHNFSVLDHNEVRQPMQTENFDTGKETLGVFLAPDGNTTTAVKELVKKAEKWRDNIKVGHISRDLAWQAVETTIIKTLEYPLPALLLSEKDCKKIMAPVLEGALSKTSISKSFPIPIRHASRQDGGLNLPDLFVSQGAMKIQKLQQFLGTSTITGKLIKVSLETCILEVGIGRNLFQLDFDKFGHLLTKSWIKSIWEFAQDHNIEIIDRSTSFPSLQRENDVFLMEVFQHEGFTTTELHKINQCRLYLQVLTLSDVMNGFGNGFTSAYNVIMDPTRKSQYNWPNSKKPSSSYIKVWRKALRTTFGLRRGQTEFTLGKWLHSNMDKWNWFYDPITQNLYQRMGLVWRRWTRQTSRGAIGLTPIFRYFSNALSLPRTACRATVLRIDQHKMKLTGWKDCEEGEDVMHSNAVTPIRFQSENIDSFGSRQQLAQKIGEGKAEAVSDGSFNKESSAGAAAWIICSDDDEHAIINGCITTGHPEIQNPYRSELFGILGILIDVTNLCKQFHITAGAITIHCDGKSALDRASANYEMILNNSKHFDVLHSILQLKRQLPITIDFQHVKGHQDNNMAYIHLSRLAQFNVRMDREAKEMLIRHTATNTLTSNAPLPLSNCDVILKQDNKSFNISSSLLKTIKKEIYRLPSREYWIKKKKMEHHNHLMDWKLRSKSINNIPVYESRWLAKFSTGFCGTGKMLKYYKYQHHSNCPLCNDPLEDTTHVLRCKHKQATKTWEEQFKSFKTWIRKTSIHPDIADAIILNLKEWRAQRVPRTLDNAPREINRAILEQSQMGWQNFIEGFWTKSWLDIQNNYFKAMESPRSAILIMSKAQRRIWKIAWQMWLERNSHLHNVKCSVHPQEEINLNREISHEWSLGISALDEQYRNYFNGQLEQLLQKRQTNKINWLFGIWAARETVNGAHLITNTHEFSNAALRNKYLKWKSKVTKEKPT